MKLLTSVFLFLFGAALLQAQNLEIAKKSLTYLASDELEGRFPGTKGDSLSQAYMLKQFQMSGVASFPDGYIQPFEMMTSIERAPETRLAVNDKELSSNQYQLFNFSADAALKAPVILIKELPDTKNVQYNGEWLLYFPEFGTDEVPSYRELVQIAGKAQRLGAGGLLLVASGNWGNNEEFYPFHYSRSMVRLDIPVFQLSRNAVSGMIPGFEFQSQGMESYGEKGKKYEIDVLIDGKSKIIENKSITGNVYGFVSADNSDEWIVLGAHYDHLGYGGYGSGSRSPERHEIHNGADDNASGTAMVLMLADHYAKNPPLQNMLFVLFAAEEEGLIGSKYFVENSPVELKKIRAMINFDMVGRVTDDKLSISGTGTAAEFNGILEAFQNKPLELTLSEGGYAGSDQASFVSENIPVLFFNSGLHDDYHRPEDDVSKINFKGMKQVGELTVNLTDSLMHPALELTFQAQKQEERSRHYGDEMKVSMGIMPDVTGRIETGLAVDGVRPGGPADNAGLQKGDVIHKMGEFEIENIYDYMECLSKFEKGQKAVIELERSGEKIQLEVKF